MTTTNIKIKVPADTRGHRISFFSHEDSVFKNTAEMIYLPGDEKTLDLMHPLNVSHSCAVCDEYASWDYERDETGKPVKMTSKTECPWPDGMETVFRIKITSGKIVVDDDLRDVFPDPDPDGKFPSINSALGCKRVSEVHAEELNLAHGFVGNTGPILQRVGEDHYVIASPGGDEDFEGGTIEIPGAVDLAHICTDLWWYSIADYGDYVARGGKTEDPSWTRTVVDFPNGVYEFTHHTTLSSFDRDDYSKPVIYADIRKVADA